MTGGTASYQSSLPAGREHFAQLLHAEWTKFRTVRGWVIGALLSALLIVAFAYLATFHHQDGGICVGGNPATGTCQSFAHPTPPLGPQREPVSDGGPEGDHARAAGENIDWHRALVAPQPFQSAL